MSKTPDNSLQLVPTVTPRPAAPLDDEIQEMLRDMKERQKKKKKSTDGSDDEPPK